MSEDERAVAEFFKLTEIGPASRYWFFAFFGVIAGVMTFLVPILAAAIFRPDIDASALFGRVWGDMVGIGVALAIFFVGIERLRVRLDRRTAYWGRLPSEGRVALERVVLQGAVAFWADDPVFGPVKDRSRPVEDWQRRTVAPRTQIVLARTIQGWWSRPQRVPRGWDGRPELFQTLASEVTVAYAPRTEIELGIRIAGSEIPVVATSDVLTGDELEMLRRATGSRAGDLPSGHVQEPDAVRAIDALVRARLGASARAIPGLDG